MKGGGTGLPKETVCACASCVFACKVSPCSPTLADAARLILEGYGPRLMLAANQGVLMLLPAVGGFEGASAPATTLRHVFPPVWGRGRCSFLTEKGLCELHAPGLKPLEGRLASHAPSAPGEGEAVGALIVRTWDRPEGQALCEAWARARESEGDIFGSPEGRACVEAALRHGQTAEGLREVA